MADNNGEILKLATGAVDVVTEALAETITGIIGKFALIVEKGTGVFLLAAGAAFVCLGIALAWQSKSNEPHSTALIVCGVLLMLAGAATNLIAFKWRLDAYTLDQSQRMEVLRLKVGLREVGIGAIVENSKIIGQQTAPPEEPPKAGEIPRFPGV
jgi:hypothetical protein